MHWSKLEFFQSVRQCDIPYVWGNSTFQKEIARKNAEKVNRPVQRSWSRKWNINVINNSLKWISYLATINQHIRSFHELIGGRATATAPPTSTASSATTTKIWVKNISTYANIQELFDLWQRYTDDVIIIISYGKYKREIEIENYY